MAPSRGKRRRPPAVALGAAGQWRRLRDAAAAKEGHEERPRPSVAVRAAWLVAVALPGALPVAVIAVLLLGAAAYHTFGFLALGWRSAGHLHHRGVHLRCTYQRAAVR
eukprot:10576725-Alexandrium_andersonii.AAC.1